MVTRKSLVVLIFFIKHTSADPAFSFTWYLVDVKLTNTTAEEQPIH